jgi:hypothetical protein
LRKWSKCVAHAQVVEEIAKMGKCGAPTTGVIWGIDQRRRCREGDQERKKSGRRVASRPEEKGPARSRCKQTTTYACCYETALKDDVKDDEKQMLLEDFKPRGPEKS